MNIMPGKNAIQHDRLFMLIQAIRDHARFDHPVTAFDLIETHISYILLTGPYAYKFKKPVNLGFLDFSTLEKRKFYCEEELRLNRRLAPGIYQGLIAVTGDERHPRFGGTGDVLEYAVKMVQFSAAEELERVVQEGRLEYHHIDQLADSIAAFHQEIVHAGPDAHYGSPDIVRRYAMENFSYIRPAVANQKKYLKLAGKLEQWIDAELVRLDDVFRERRQQGFVRECHGDLHIGNIALHDGKPVIFDCIEFNPELHWIDTVSEIAFLIMDLDARQQTEFGRRFLNKYLELTGDYSGLALLRFYLVYRALVRCKIACIRLDQPELTRQGGALELQHEHRYLELATAYTCVPEPRLIITHGLSGSGKTTITQALLETLGAIRLRSDIERQRLFGLPASTTAALQPGAGKYNETGIRRTYQCLADISESILAAGFPVIVDATFLHAYQRDMFRQIAVNGGYRFVILDCRAPEAQLRDRILRRMRHNQDASEATLEILDHQFSSREPLSAMEQKFTIVMDNAGMTAPDAACITRLVHELTHIPMPTPVITGP